MKAKNIVSAPRKNFLLGMRVQVIDSPESDHQYPEVYNRKKGVVVGFDNVECGATPKDPMIMIKFDKPVKVECVRRQDPEGYKFVEKDGFWSEELKIL